MRGVAGLAENHKHQDGTKHVTRGIERARRVFIRSLGDEEHMELINRVVVECQQQEATYEWSYAMMRASGRSIPRGCYVLEHDFQNSQVVL